jgi:hypothetical protein
MTLRYGLCIRAERSGRWTASRARRAHPTGEQIPDLLAGPEDDWGQTPAHAAACRTVGNTLMSTREVVLAQQHRPGEAAQTDFTHVSTVGPRRSLRRLAWATSAPSFSSTRRLARRVGQSPRAGVRRRDGGRRRVQPHDPQPLGRGAHRVDGDLERALQPLRLLGDPGRRDHVPGRHGPVAHPDLQSPLLLPGVPLPWIFKVRSVRISDRSTDRGRLQR